MKRIYILLVFLVFGASGYSQGTWGPPYPLTDSLTDNLNATLSIFPGSFGSDTLYMFWERWPDANSSAIFGRNLKTMGNPFLVASHPNAHFRHPRVFGWASGDTLFDVSYETDMNGSWDLYYSAILRSQTVAGPFPFIISSQDEKNLNWGSSMIFSWEKEGNIYVKEYYSDTVKLPGNDSCHNPVEFADAMIAYEMSSGSANSVVASKYDFTNHAWAGPFPIDLTGNNSHLSYGNDSYGVSSLMLYQHSDGPFWKIKGFDINGTFNTTFNNFPGCNNVSPSYCNVNIPIDKEDKMWPPFTYSTFASDYTGNWEIYVNDVMGDTIYSNLSVNSSSDTHPQLFNNCHSYGTGLDNQLFDIWESFRGGHWQLWTSNLDILANVHTQSASGQKSIRATPNPSGGFTFIEYTTPDSGEIPIDIYDLSGKKVITLISHTSYIIATKVNMARWDGLNDSGSRVPPGIYFASPGNDSSAPRCKIIRQ